MAMAHHQELESGALLQALKRIFLEEKENPDVLEKVLWLLTNVTYVLSHNTREQLRSLTGDRCV